MILEYSGRIFTDVLCDSNIPLSPFRQSCEPVSTVRFKSIRLARMFHITADIFLRYGSNCFHIIGMVPQLVSYFRKMFEQFSAGNTFILKDLLHQFLQVFFIFWIKYLPPVFHWPYHIVVDITHASPIMHKIFFYMHIYSITQESKTRNNYPNIFSIIYMWVTELREN